MRYTLIILAMLSLLASLAADPAQTVQFGRKLYDDGLYSEAVRAFEDVLRQAPASPEAEEALFYIAESWRRRGDWIRAGVHYRRLLDGFPSTARREEALRRWGESLVEQGSFIEATVPFEELVERYPQSPHTRASLAPLAHTWFETGQYARLVEVVEAWQKDYRGHPELPAAIYWEAEALIGSGLEPEGRTLLQRLATEHRDHDAGWRAVRRLARIIEESEDIEAAAAYLSAQVWLPGRPGQPADQLPRQLAEELVRLLLRYDRLLERWNDMHTDADYLFTTFSRSDNYERYYIAVMQSLLGLGNHDAIIGFEQSHPHEFRDEALARHRDLLMARAMLSAGQVETALERGELLTRTARADSLRAQAMWLVADANEEAGRKRDALTAYRQLVSRYPSWVDATSLHMHIGDLYAEAFSRPDMALPYYRQAVGGATDNDLLASAHLALAASFERLGRYDDARLELDQVPLHTLDDSELAQRIKHQRYCLHRFYGGQPDDAIAYLATSVAAYAEHGSQQQLRDELSVLLSRHSRRFEEALALAPNDASPASDSRRALLFIDLMEKTRYEDRLDDARGYQEQLAVIRARYPDDHATAREIDLNLLLRLETDYAVHAGLSGRIEALLAAAPDVATAELLHLAAADGWLLARDSARALPHLRALAPGALVPPSEYRRGKLLLGDILFHRGELTAARNAYALAQVDLFSSGAEAVYRYARSLEAAGETEAALETMSFLLDNGEPFPAQPQAIAFAVESWRNRGRYDRALHYLRLMSPQSRDTAYWTSLADIHVALDQPEQARTALQSIEEKSTATLYKLAELQMQTGDWEAAVQSFTGLEGRDAANLTLYRIRHAQALFALEDYQAALAVFEQVVPKLTSDPARYVGFDLHEAVQQTIISAYQAGNRPRAGQLRKQFKDLLEEDTAAQARLNLHEGIYYTRMDAGKAAKQLGKLAADEQAPQDIRRQAAFWQGVAYINAGKPDKAAASFQPLAAQSTDPRLQAQAQLKLGTLAFSGEEYERALEYYAWVIEHD
ncbi:MAG: tetratricopeptide repeat protein, partial [Candidatus Cloacimonetes bacterium]|nr:tetratricopeptide repeat protein [Candidatus Cloacimonadota bacterium]